MPLSRFARVAATVLLAASIIGPASAQPGRGTTGIRITIAEPRFAAEAVRFKAIDQTGYTNVGSDEVHAVFVDFNPLQERATSEYGSVDAGETKNFRAADRCIAPQPDCSVGSSSSISGSRCGRRIRPGTGSCQPAWSSPTPAIVTTTAFAAKTI